MHACPSAIPSFSCPGPAGRCVISSSSAIKMNIAISDLFIYERFQQNGIPTERLPSADLRFGEMVEEDMTIIELREDTSRQATTSCRGVHHLALNTEDMKATVEFYTEVLGMPLVHAMRVPPGVGTGPGNRGNPPFENIRHYFFDMGNDSLLAFFEMPKGAKQAGD